MWRSVADHYIVDAYRTIKEEQKPKTVKEQGVQSWERHPATPKKAANVTPPTVALVH